MNHRDTDTLDATAVAASLRLSVTRLARLLRQKDPDSLSATLASALGTINLSGPVTFGELAASEHLTAPSVSKIVEKLELLGYVERLQDARDRRVWRVKVTTAGKRHIKAARARRTAWLATRLRDLPADDLARLAAAAPVLEALLQLPTDDES